MAFHAPQVEFPTVGKPRNVCCEICGQYFVRGAHLLRHWRRKHPDQKKPSEGQGSEGRKQPAVQESARTCPADVGFAESTNRKLLEQLAEQKKRLQGGLRGGHATGGGGGGAPSTSSVPGSSVLPSAAPVGVPGPPPVTQSMAALPPDAAGMTSQQRTALQYAHANSVGYFITQDSSFGNLILPVLPRYADK